MPLVMSLSLCCMALPLACLWIAHLILCSYLLYLRSLLLVLTSTPRLPHPQQLHSRAWRESRTQNAVTWSSLSVSVCGCPAPTCLFVLVSGSCPAGGLVPSPWSPGWVPKPTVSSCLVAGRSILCSTPASLRRCRAGCVRSKPYLWRAVLWRTSTRSTTSSPHGSTGAPWNIWCTGRALAAGKTPGNQPAIYATPREPQICLSVPHVEVVGRSSDSVWSMLVGVAEEEHLGSISP